MKHPSPASGYCGPRCESVPFHPESLPDHLKHIQAAPNTPKAISQPPNKTVAGWESEAKNMQRKALSEGIGANGGFLVPTEFRPDILAVDPLEQPVRSRATLIPMARRAIQIPVLDQTGTTTGSPSWFGGLDAFWTEEAAAKTEDSQSHRRSSSVNHEIREWRESKKQQPVIHAIRVFRGPQTCARSLTSQPLAVSRVACRRAFALRARCGPF